MLKVDVKVEKEKIKKYLKRIEELEKVDVELNYSSD